MFPESVGRAWGAGSSRGDAVPPQREARFVRCAAVAGLRHTPADSE